MPVLQLGSASAVLVFDTAEFQKLVPQAGSAS